MYLRQRINTIRRHPCLIIDILMNKNWAVIEDKSGTLDEKEIYEFISHLKTNSAYELIKPPDEPRLNRLCYVEDWENTEITAALSQLGKLSLEGFIHRKDWEWALGIIAMRRFNKLNESSRAIGIGSGTEPVPFYLSNKIKHVYATDLYGENAEWHRSAPLDFLNNPGKYSSLPYKKDALTVLKMDGTSLDFKSEIFDIAFSFSSIEHFGGKNHSGSLVSLREMERVLKKGGIAVITTEFILNNKNHPQFFNLETIYSDLINRLEHLQLVEPLDLRTTSKTLNTVINFSEDMNWNSMDSNYKKNHPVIIIRIRNILFTSIMLVLRKE